jgi:lysozyme
MNKLKTKLIAAFLAAGLSAPAAFVAYDLTLPSEGYVPSVYSDPVGLKTYCVGHLALKGEKLQKSYTDEECMAVFASDWKKHLKQLDSVVKVPYKSEWQRQALNDFTFNVGIGNVTSSTLLKKLNSGQHVDACKQLTRWTKGRVKGVLTTLKGLVTRRDNTMPFCLGELAPEKHSEFEKFEEEYEVIKRQKESN